MKTHLGEFISTTIHANTLREAREILGRTYCADRWTLKRNGKFDPGRVIFGARYGWTFRVIPKAS